MICSKLVVESSRPPFESSVPARALRLDKGPCELPELPIIKAAVCNAVAAADRRAAWDRASANFFAQSGLIVSVVMTLGALTERDWPRRRLGAGVPPGLLCSSDDVEDIPEWVREIPPGTPLIA